MRLNSKLLLIRGSQTGSGVLEKEGGGGGAGYLTINKKVQNGHDGWF